MKKLVIAVVAAAGIGAVLYVNYTATQEVKQVVDQQIAALSEQSGVDIQYQDISASVLNNSMQLSGLVVKSLADNKDIAQIDQVEVTGYEVDKVAPHTRFVMTNFRFSEAFLAQLPADANNKLAAASYDVNSALDYDKNSGNSDFALKVKANEVADFSFNIGVAKSTALMDASMAISKEQQALNGQALTLQQQLQQQSKIMAAMSELEPRSVALGINNQGELKQVITSLLQAQGMTPEQFQQTLAMQLQQAPVSEELATALTNFAKGFESLSLSASLPEGQTMMEINQQIMALMAQPEELAKFINLKAKGE
ncbi:hypothetical protein [Pseudoalteromonas mariniglutinosa]|uniref:hypothetical protein n=1 Tax=Pseudoalteromonas mariniglutinosa TaxID=206042 RepID=UPI00384F0808